MRMTNSIEIDTDVAAAGAAASAAAPGLTTVVTRDAAAEAAATFVSITISFSFFILILHFSSFISFFHFNFEFLHHFIILVGNRQHLTPPPPQGMARGGHPRTAHYAKMSSKGRIELQMGVSGVDIREKPAGDVRFCVVPQKRIKNCEKLIFRPIFKTSPSRLTYLTYPN